MDDQGSIPAKAIALKPDLGPTELSTHGVLGDFSLRVKRPGHEC
jgi:hypothetical protein